MDPDVSDIVNIVVVRFSLRVPEWQRRAFVDDRNREAWFRYRAGLYRATLGQAMRAQSKPVDGLYLIMDAADPPLYEQHLRDDLIIPIFSRDGDHHRQIAEDISRRGWTERVAMSRIDSDDIVERHYLRKLDEQIVALERAGQAVEYLMPCYGFRSDFARLQRQFYSRNPFITLYKRHYAGETVYTVDHRRIRELGVVDNYTAQWMQVVHGTNVANGFAPQSCPGPLPPLQEIQRQGLLMVSTSPQEPIDPAWFAEWAGFPLPDLRMFAAAPLRSPWDRMRILWRRARGRL